MTTAEHTASMEQAAARLRRAYREGTIEPLRETMVPTDADTAYAIQALNTRHWVAEGRRIVGRKIGLTSRAVQAQLGVDRPDFGVLFEDMRIENGGTLDTARTIQAKAEAEIAIVLAQDVDMAEPSAADMLAAIDHVVAAIEIVDSRIADWRITFADTVADNGSSAFFVLGSDRRKAEGLDLYSCGMVLEVDGAVASIGAGAACLGHPLNAAAWLAGTLSRRGEALKAGDIILTGALGPMVTLAPGMRVSAAIGGLGRVGFNVKG